METIRDRWPSRLSFVMAAVGSAVGLGNIWRFPYVAYENGGGAFLIPYFVALVSAGVPLMILEYALGQRFQAAAPQALAKIREGFRWVGWFALLVGLSVVFYYTAVMAYTWTFMFASPTLAWTKTVDPEKYLVVQTEAEKALATEEEQRLRPESPRQVVTRDENAGVYFTEKLLGGFRTGEWKEAQTAGRPYVRGMFKPVGHLVFFTLLTWLLVYVIIYKGPESVGKVVLWTVPIPVLLLGVMIVYGFSLDGARRGIEFFLEPNWSILGNMTVWLKAYGQVFFSLSLGFGILIAYASYKPRDSDVSNNAFITSFANCATSFYGSFAVFSVLGYLATALNKEVADVVASGPGLVFVTYPVALAKMGFMGRIMGVLFFLSLLTLGIDSAFSLVEAIVAGLHDRLPQFSRPTLNGLICGLGFVFGLLFCTRSGLMWLDIVDNWMSNYGLVIVGLLECIAVGYFFDIAEIRKFVNRRSEIRIDPWWDAFIKFVIPAVLIYLLGVQISKDLSTVYGGYDQILRGAVAVMGWGYLLFLMVIAFILGRNWVPFLWISSIMVLTVLIFWVFDTSLQIAGMAALGMVLLFGGLLTCAIIAVRGELPTYDVPHEEGGLEP